MENLIITIVGGTGFLGRYVVRDLARAGYRLRVIARHPDAALFLKTACSPGRIVLERGDIVRPESLAHKIGGSWAVVNLAGILHESGRQTFSAVHARGPEKLAEMARAAGVSRFIHVSALGVGESQGSTYARSKLLGEKAVLAAFPSATILRPSIIFGTEDNFFNRFAQMARFSPVLPLIGGGRTRLQPVYAGDAAKAVLACLARADGAGCIYELGGPQIYTFRELMEYILHVTGRRRALVSVPFSVASCKAAFLELLPRPPLTRDQVRLLRADNVVALSALTFADLGISPTAMEMIVPEYLSRFHRKMAA
ncbi:MAG: complex I NDUFA9 subunit family protein [Pseudomonadota bacterium]|nr:complex I NDUFA9 subunit family protein [Pseudomonadota bacterium]MDE3037209.1 complex I NDUFA9 subunit family protein [Pseudomonadota bacterium]